MLIDLLRPLDATPDRGAGQPRHRNLRNNGPQRLVRAEPENHPGEAELAPFTLC